MKVVRKLLLSLGVFVAALLLAEVGYRTLLAARGSPYDGGKLVAELARLIEPMRAYVPPRAVDSVVGETAESDSVRILHPFYASEQFHDTGGVIAKFRRGFSEDAYVIVVVGGSVAGNWAGYEAKPFARALEGTPEFPGEVVVLNAGHAAYKQPQQINRITFLLSQGFVPDAVINIDGFNEVCGGLSNGINGTHPVYPNFPVWGGVLRRFGSIRQQELDLFGRIWCLKERAHAALDTTRELGLHHSSLLGRLAQARVRALCAQGVALQQEYMGLLKDTDPRRDSMLHGPPFDADLEKLVEASVTNWYLSSLSLDGLCRAHGIYYLHVLQPALYYADSKPMTELEKALPQGTRGWTLGPELGYERLREKGLALVQEGVAFADATMMYAETHEDIYIDACHVNAVGNAKLREFITRAFYEFLPERRR